MSEGMTKKELSDALAQAFRERDELARKYRELTTAYDELVRDRDQLVDAQEVTKGEDRKLVAALNEKIETLTAAVEEMTSVAAFMSLKVQAPEQAARAFTILGIDP